LPELPEIQTLHSFEVIDTRSGVGVAIFSQVYTVVSLNSTLSYRETRCCECSTATGQYLLRCNTEQGKQDAGSEKHYQKTKYQFSG
jgi:hypothetical protein